MSGQVKLRLYRRNKEILIYDEMSFYGIKFKNMYLGKLVKDKKGLYNLKFNPFIEIMSIDENLIFRLYKLINELKKHKYFNRIVKV